MKRIAVLSLLLFLLMASVVPVMASGGNPGGSSVVMNGSITAIDAQNRTITILTISGPYPQGQDLVVYTTARTRYSEQIASGVCVPITFEDLAVGDLVGVTGRFVDGQFIATRITVKM